MKMMSFFCYFLSRICFALAVLLFLSGCSGERIVPISAGTNVDLSHKNFRMIKSNAIGSSSGLKLLGLIPIYPPSYTDAMSELYSNGGVRDGKATALTNVTQEEGGLFLFLISIPKLTVRADIIEFTDEKIKTPLDAADAAAANYSSKTQQRSRLRYP